MVSVFPLLHLLIQLLLPRGPQAITKQCCFWWKDLWMERDFLATTTAGECNALIFPHKTELPTSPLQCLYFPLPLNDAMILLWEPCYQKEDWKEATHIAALLADGLCLVYQISHWDKCMQYIAEYCLGRQNVISIWNILISHWGVCHLLCHLQSAYVWNIGRLWLLPSSPSGLYRLQPELRNLEPKLLIKHFSGLSWLKSKFLHAAGAGYWDEMCSQWNHFVETLECNQLSQVAHLIGNLASLGVE